MITLEDIKTKYFDIKTKGRWDTRFWVPNLTNSGENGKLYYKLDGEIHYTELTSEFIFNAVVEGRMSVQEFIR